MCMRNQNGQYQSCIEARNGLGGYEDYDVCHECADNYEELIEIMRDALILVEPHCPDWCAKVVVAAIQEARRIKK